MPDPQIQQPDQQTPPQSGAIPTLAPAGQQDAPTFSSGALGLSDPNFDYSGLKPEDIQKVLVQQLGKLSGMLDPASSQNKDISKQLQAFSYTPEQRAQDMYNRMMGISKDPQTGQVKHNWLQMLLGGAQEAVRGAQEKGNYVPPMERFHEQAIKEYGAEALPAAREMLYNTQDRHNLMTNISGLMGTLSRSQQAEYANKVKEQRVIADNFAKQNAALLINPKIQELYARSQKETDQSKLIAINQQLEQAKTELTKAQTKNIQGGASSEEREIGRLMHDEGLTYGQAMDRVNASKALSKPELTSGVGPQGEPIVVNKLTDIAKPVTIQGQSNSNNSAAGQDYYGGAIAGKAQFADMPSNIPDDMKDILTSIPLRKPLTGEDLRRSNAATLGYQNAQQLYGMLGKMTSSQIGMLAGNWQKYIQGSTSAADPNINAFINTAKILGANHSAAQAFRSTQFVDEIGNAIAKLGTNKKAIAKGIESYENTFVDALSNYPQAKIKAFAKQMPAYEALRVFTPDQYNKLVLQDAKNVKEGDTAATNAALFEKARRERFNK